MDVLGVNSTKEKEIASLLQRLKKQQAGAAAAYQGKKNHSLYKKLRL